MGQSSKAQDNCTPKTDQILRQQHYPNHSYSTTVLTTSRKKTIVAYLSCRPYHNTKQYLHPPQLKSRYQFNAVLQKAINNGANQASSAHTVFVLVRPRAQRFRVHLMQTSRIRSMEVNSISNLHPHPLNSEH